MRWIAARGLHWREDGDPSGAPVVFANSLGTDLRLWDPVLPHLPGGLRIIRYDKRGHGLSEAPPGPYAMGTLVADAEAVIDAAGAREVAFVGLSVGGMIAQGLAAKRLDLVRVLALSSTGVKIGTRRLWQDRIDAVRREGLAAMAPAILERWFAPAFRAGDAVPPWRRMIETQFAQGYAGTCAAIAGTDLHSVAQDLRLPVLALAGTEDRATPPDLVREMADLIPGSRFELIRGAGHLPCVERPEAFAAALAGFLRATGHVA
ncbi:3-oxoadipate enol-lactonase [Hasllibacter halocynthiae]|uniref:3-oxoadipate enol-lactonase n=1 Tax=Hasllibacter halocynthiae TaxID=595589 RepID=A0A2T0X144_9RHOB|nr:3-oxoadipate enol-lactonase [Hasllibacter halocynthiae]PRY92669.1 3-oxoadipate enol-lactonase [Hasllibacter halocynthiae]